MRSGRALILALAAACAALTLLPASAPAAELQRLIAPAHFCPGQGDPLAPIHAQEEAMLCLTNFARHRDRLPRLSDDRALDWSAGHKSHDILRCDQFEHEACGRVFTHWFSSTGYLHGPCWRVGENIAEGGGASASPRAIFEAWIHSSPHRHNILGPYRDLGVGLRIGTLDGRPRVHIWTQHFGAHC